MRHSKHLLAFLIALSLCIVAIWREMQALAIVAFSVCVLTIYQRQSNLLFDLGTSLVSRTRQAKLGDLEIEINDRKINLTEGIEKTADHLRILLDGLDGDHVGWLLTIHKQGRYEAPAATAIKDRLRQLRNRGLLFHDTASLQDARFVWLTPLGEELVSALLSVSPDLQQTPAIERNLEHTMPTT